MLRLAQQKSFANGKVYLLHTEDGYPTETTDTFLPRYTKDAKTYHTNKLQADELGSRADRWMVGVSVMSGCPVRCKFCATGALKKWRNLTAQEIVEQVKFACDQDSNFSDAFEHKVNYTRMGEPFLNIGNVRKAIGTIEKLFPGTHHYVSTIGVKNSDFSWIRDNISLQISVHALQDKRRRELIPYWNLMSLEELGQIRTESKLKTTINLTLVEETDFDIETLKKYFDPKYFFVKLSPINKNVISESNHLGDGVISGENIV